MTFKYPKLTLGSLTSIQSVFGPEEEKSCFLAIWTEIEAQRRASVASLSLFDAGLGKMGRKSLRKLRLPPTHLQYCWPHWTSIDFVYFFSCLLKKEQVSICQDGDCRIIFHFIFHFISGKVNYPSEAAADSITHHGNKQSKNHNMKEKKG